MGIYGQKMREKDEIQGFRIKKSEKVLGRKISGVHSKIDWKSVILAV